VAESTCTECGGELIGPVTLEVIAGGDSGELQAKVRTDTTEVAERWRQGDR
jgi:hypothetical protein